MATATPTTASSTPTAVPVTTLSIALKEQNTSGQTGYATLTAKGEQTEVVLRATTASPKANHIHTGTRATLGAVVNPLTNMADGRSVTSLTVTLDPLRTGAFAVNLHNATTSSIDTSCGDIPKAA